MNNLPKVGDKIIFNENLEKLSVFNGVPLVGTTGIVSFIDKVATSEHDGPPVKTFYKIFIAVNNLGRSLFLYDNELNAIDLLEGATPPKTNEDAVEVNKDNHSFYKYKHSPLKFAYSSEEEIAAKKYSSQYSSLEELDDELLSINNSLKNNDLEENYHTKFKLNDLVYVNEENSKYFFGPSLMLHKVFLVTSISEDQFNICNIHNIHDKFFLPAHYIKYFNLFGTNKKYKSKRSGGNHPLTNMFISDKLREELAVN